MTGKKGAVLGDVLPCNGKHLKKKQTGCLGPAIERSFVYLGR